MSLTASCVFKKEQCFLCLELFPNSLVQANHHCQQFSHRHLVSADFTRADSRLAPSQWQTSLQSNAVSHWLDANLESALLYWSRLLTNADYWHWMMAPWPGTTFPTSYLCHTKCGPLGNELIKTNHLYLKWNVTSHHLIICINPRQALPHHTALVRWYCTTISDWTRRQIIKTILFFIITMIFIWLLDKWKTINSIFLKNKFIGEFWLWQFSSGALQ